MSMPAFAVVGHPNKGKSSIVSTLTRQDAIKISEISGTTTSSQAFTLNIDGNSQYSLIDTPGFQRPRQVLSLLQQQSPNAAERKQVLLDFVSQQHNDVQSKYHDESELLTPILDGAGIIYVVDGSLPYSPEFEAEMTILQWTGQPRMALINPIGGETHIAEWQNALNQYFNIVRVFDPMTADLNKQFTVLSAFAELHEPWRQSIEATLDALKDYIKRIEQQGALIVAEHINQMVSHVSEIKVPTEFVQATLEKTVKAQYQHQLRETESSMQRQLQALYAHSEMQIEAQALTVDYPDLFDSSHWYLYGLDRQKIVMLSASVGAAAGVVIDIGVGGASLMTGAIAGGIISGAASLFATADPDNLSIQGVPIAGKTLTAGPIKTLSFSFVLLGRAVDFLDTLLNRTHANRSVAEINDNRFSDRFDQLSKAEQLQLTQTLQKSPQGLDEQALLSLRDLVLKLCQQGNVG
jgi:guanylate kinase